MRFTYPNRSVISIFSFILLITFLLWPPSTIHAFDMKPDKPGSQLAPRVIKPSGHQATFSSMSFKVPLRLANVPVAQVGRGLVLLCGAIYGNFDDGAIIGGMAVKPELLSSGSYIGTINVPVTMFSGTPSGEKPAQAQCLAFAKQGNQCSGLSAVLWSYGHIERTLITHMIGDCIGIDELLQGQ